MLHAGGNHKKREQPYFKVFPFLQNSDSRRRGAKQAPCVAIRVEVLINMRIALCEDKPAEAQATLRLIDKYTALHTECEITTTLFPSSGAFLEADVRAFDCCLIEIKLCDKNGIDIARTLRRQGYKAHIVFLAASPEYALSAFSVHATDYLLKPLDERSTFVALDRVRESLEMYQPAKTWRFSFRTPTGIHTVGSSEILYIEIVGHTPFFHTTEGTVRGSYMRVPFEESVRPLLETGTFLRPHRSFLINAAHIAMISAQKVRLDNQETVPIARTRAAEFKADYLKYLEIKQRA